ncbi:MAG: hypothetical protein WA919_19685 [Coleofasciculaceae cyanobacterium]
MTAVDRLERKAYFVSDSYHQLIQTALEHYKIGCAKPIVSTPETEGKSLLQLVNNELITRMDSRLSATEMLILNHTNQSRSQALQAARQKDLAKAEQLMEKVRNTWCLDRLSAEGHLLYKSFQEAAEAYLKYCNNDFDGAWSNLSEAIKTDETLEAEYGYTIMFAHRLHLVQNLVRSEARGQKTESAIKLASQLLSYLQGNSVNLPFPVVWDTKMLANLPVEIIAITFALVTNEIAVTLANKKRHTTCKFLAIIEKYIPLEEEDSCNLYPPSLTWLRIKQALSSSNIETFLELASQFLLAGRGKAPLLWYATVIDLLEVCDEFHFPGTDLVKSEAISQAADWKYFPKHFLPLLEGK